MPFEKGREKTGGKKKGSVNKSTETARLAIAKLVDKNTPNMIKWLDEIAADSPEKAFDCMTKVMEYHLPKLNRTDIGSDPEKPLIVKHNLNLSKLSTNQLKQLKEINKSANESEDSK